MRCAPPQNKPTTEERDTCAPFLVRELAALDTVRVVVALGSFGWDAALRSFATLGAAIASPRPRFGHLAEARIGRLEGAAGGVSAVGGWTLLGSYHPSQQNTFTGRLTPAMFDQVIERARALAGR